MKLSLDAAISAFGAKAKSKLSNPAVHGQPEDQIRAPFEELLDQISELCQFPKGSVAAVGESSVSDLKTRPDYAVSVHNALVGFIELKAPGKGADPRKFKDPHDKGQWEKLQSLPNLIYTDGNSFSLWQNGELVGKAIDLIGDVETSGNKLQAPPTLPVLFEGFLSWEPVPPRSAKELAETTARLCRLLREEVAEQLSLKSHALTETRDRLAEITVPRSHGRQICRRLRASGYVWNAHGSCEENRAFQGSSASRYDSERDELPHRRRSQATYRRCRKSGNA